MKINGRLDKISAYHFKDINDTRDKLIKEGLEIVDFGIGDPDLPVPSEIINELISSLSLKDFNKYPPYEGLLELKKDIIKYYKETYDVYLEEDEVIILIGSKEGISNLIPATCDFNDTVILTEPSYPVYERCCRLWGVESYKVSTSAYGNYLPNLSHIPEYISKIAKLFIINYPNNPTGAVANIDFYKSIIKYCTERNIVLCNDGAYNEILDNSVKPLSLLSVDKEKNSIEFGTLSKLYNMTGFRIAYAVGNKEVISNLLKVKSSLDSGQFVPIQRAAGKALCLSSSYGKNVRSEYDKRRIAAFALLRKHGIYFYEAPGTFYIWCRIPKSYTGFEFYEELINKYGIIVTPGYIFGSSSCEYFRISLTKPVEEIKKGLDRLGYYNGSNS